MRVRLIDADSGRVLAGKHVDVELGMIRAAPTRNTVDVLGMRRRLRSKTGTDGIAKFWLEAPLPNRVEIISPPGHWTQCSPYSYDLQEILKVGVVAENNCKPKGKLEVQFNPQPGEAVVFTQYVSLKERLKTFPG
jgi:hypothetical protein